MTCLAIAGLGVCGTGMQDWPRARVALLAANPQVAEPLPRLAPECLPATERRRANFTSRLAITAAVEAMQYAAAGSVRDVPTVFSSCDGDGDVLGSMLAALAQQPPVLSPTVFHNSVYNAPAGYWSIGQGARAASITVSAGPASFLAGLQEARAQMLDGGEPVLYVCYDAPFPAAMASFDRSADPFACALLLVPDAQSAFPPFGRIDVRGTTMPAHGEILEPPPWLALRFARNAAADGLALLHAIARARPGRFPVTALDGARQFIEYRP